MLERGELREIQVANLEIERNFYIAQWETPYPIPAVQAFSRYLQNELK